LIILDAVKGISEANLITDLEQLKSENVVSMHDFGLSLNLKLIDKLGLLDSVMIFGIPYGLGEDETLAQIQLIFKKCAAQLMQGS